MRFISRGSMKPNTFICVWVFYFLIGGFTLRGSIRKHGNGYQIRVDLGKDENGKRKQKAVGGFRTKAEAEAGLNELLVKLQNGEYAEESTINIKDYLSKWLKYIKPNVEDTTYVFYRDMCAALTTHLGKVQVTKLKPLQIQDFITKLLDGNERKLSPTTVRHYYNVLNIALNQAVKWEIIKVNPCNSVDPPRKAETKFDVLEPDEVEMFLDYIKNSDYSVMYIPVHLALYCGLRRGEILGLTWNNIDLKQGIIRIVSNRVVAGKEEVISTPKTDKSMRSVAISKHTIEILKEHYKEQNENEKILTLYPGKQDKDKYVCTWPGGKLIRPDYLTKTLKKVLKQCNLPNIRFHDLRHTHATLLLLAGVNLKVVSERLGHSKTTFTADTYAHVLPQMQQEAVEKFDNLVSKKAK